MASPSVTYTFANSTTADATQVNTNFTDLINGMSDGTKDFSINAITAAGTATFNGNVNIGNASGDDLTITASLASTLLIKTTATYNIGDSTHGLLGVYVAGTSSFTTVIKSAATATYTLTLPATAGTDGFQTVTDGSGGLSFVNTFESMGITNAGLTATVATSALTVALKGANGSDPSSSNPVWITFRNATSATGSVSAVKVSSALSVVVSSGSTLGTISAQPQYVYVYALNNAGTVELAISGSRVFDDGSTQSTTAEGGSGGADSKYVLYSTTARTGVAVRYLGRILSTQATAGTWASAVTEISLQPADKQVQQRSIIKVTTPTGFGSTNTKIRKYSVTEISIGSDITYNSSATNGDNFTINKEGIYVFSVSDYRSGGSDYLGISKNSSQLTTDIDTQSTTSQVIAMNRNTGTTVYFTLTSPPTLCSPGDVIRAHSLGLSDSTAAFAFFQAVKISD